MAIDGFFPRRRTWLAAALIVVAPWTAATEQSTWPARPITIVVPYTPGTSMDVLARVLGPRLSQKLGQPVIVENRAGASGNIGTGYVAESPPDGHTLLMTVSTFVMNPSLFKKVPYDPLASFVPVGRVAVGALVLAVHPTFPAATLPEAIDAFRSRPGRYAYSSPGNGTPQHLAMELFKMHAGVDLMHVPYSGSAGAVTDLLGGQVQAMILPANTALGLRQAGKLRVLAATQERRIPVMSDVPTLAEQGIRGADVDLWFGMLAPARTPPAVVARLNREINEILAMADIQETLSKQGLTVAPGTPEAFGTLVSAEYERWADVIRKARITAD
ncbi:MAG: tripartite tricarboxylate transporter substrate binding protein [Pigmentiphaga sp.]|uniref:Bug family tripartite tricarboxylate transporter substrate binding protein n=1 Tax=Pigmentiphaga sp. TaxID=1977564 RepID=UPI0029A6F0B7|nr:tripartite tricarboxylate transporter substrate binding protein [Pigmentiphaga sp.]MDX3908165.1 tripartite tricarboxylate transporter substrate binding protein [Pigmentiphaga sp.]